VWWLLKEPLVLSSVYLRILLSKSSFKQLICFTRTAKHQSSRNLHSSTRLFAVTSQQICRLHYMYQAPDLPEVFRLLRVSKQLYRHGILGLLCGKYTFEFIYSKVLVLILTYFSISNLVLILCFRPIISGSMLVLLQSHKV